ncbi:EF-hand domain pair [Popillia japonica]|uniref:nicotinamidase n=1 Tax=Popillia japonica TaxID=7064 RepID=A0AAW1KSF6_POPJA
MITLIQRQDSSPMDGLDHLFLLPERALTMDATRLQKDLAGLDFDVRLLHEAPMGNIWLSGSRPSSATKEDPKARLRTLKERQHEERRKKLEEMQEQAMALQRFKEKKEMERKLRMDEIKQKEEVKRQLVEDRKKAINDAERDRLESILKRNQEREARIEAKRRNERHSIVFAFGSSTPRMLQPTDSVGSFWGHRRATSTQNITTAAAPLTRRQSERELDGGIKKRATSAGGLERSVEAPTPQAPAGCASGYVGRRRTDLMPTIPSRDSPSAPPRKSFTRSPAPSRPSSSLSQQSTSSVTSSVNMRTRPIAAPRRPRPVSIAVTGISTDLNKNGTTTDVKKPETKPPLPKTRKSSLVKSTEKLKKKSVASPTEGSPKLLVSPTYTVPVTHSPTIENNKIKEVKAEDTVVVQHETIEHREEFEVSGDAEVTTGITEQIHQPDQTDVKPEEPIPIEEKQEVEPPPKQEVTEIEAAKPEIAEEIKEEEKPKEEDAPPAPVITETVSEVVEHELISEPQPEPTTKIEQEKKMDTSTTQAIDLSESITDMTASMIKVRINTEEEAKAALAERRRLAREEAERQAEMERRRIEEEQRLEFERQQREEEQQRILIEKLRAEEQQRLEEAIKEAQKREEEQRLRKEEENRMRVLKEEAERRQREEAERQKAELQERLKNEEKEREARRKRVEAIMLRTRGKNSVASNQQSEEKNDENKSEKINGSKGDAPENGHKNGKEIDNVDNIIPVETLKNANTVNNVDNNLSTDDTLNSNNAWQHNTSVDRKDIYIIANPFIKTKLIYEGNQSRQSVSPRDVTIWIFGTMTTFENIDSELVFNCEDSMDACFTAFDKNGDGKLDLDEFRLICRALFRNDKGKIYTLEEEKLKDVFEVFDQNGDEFIDKDEFVFCWNHWIKVIVRPISAFLIIDVQNDFISGTLNISNCSAQQNGLEVLEPINRLLETVEFDAVFYSLDWHPSDHVSFIDNINQREIDPSSPITAENAQVYDTVIFLGPPPMKQRLWPRHCVQDTWGSELHKDLKVIDTAVKVYKGTNPEVDSYSVFWDNKKLTDTTLSAQLRQKNATDIYICGLAYDICVGATAVDALAIGYRTILLDDCSRGVDLLDIEKTKNSVIKNNGVIVNSNQVKAMVEGRDRRPELGYKLAMELRANRTE